MHPDVSDSALLDTWNDLKNENTPLNWVVYGYVPKTDKLRVDSSGNGGLSELMDNISEGRVHYAFIRYNVNGTWKFVYIAWCGEGVAGMRRGSFTNHALDVAKFFQGFHVQINARTEGDLEESKILARLKTATGSHGRKNERAKVQGSTGSDSASSGAGASQPAPNAIGGGAFKGNLKSESDAFWAKQREEDERLKKENSYVPQREAAWKTQPQSAAVGKQWEQKQQQQQAPPPRAAPAPSGSTGRLAANFNQPPAAAPAAAPPKPRQVQPPPAAAPPPVYEEQYAPPPEETYASHEDTYAPPPEDTYAPPAEDTYAIPQESYDNYAPPEDTYAPPEDTYVPLTEDTYAPPPEDASSYDGGYQQEESYGEYGGAPEDSSYAPADDESYGGDTYGGSGVQCRALYAYEAANEGDLPFAEGDIITVIDQANPDGWWEGELNGARGFFPSNFVQLL